MLTFAIQRFLGMIVTLFMVSIMVFVIMELPPGDYADRYVFRKYSGTGQVVSEADIQNVRVQLGLDRPAWQRYFTWIGLYPSKPDLCVARNHINIGDNVYCGILEGNLGEAFSFATSVNTVIGQRIWLTIAVLFSTLLVTYLVSIPIGIYAAVRRHSVGDYALTIVSYFGLALPNFLLALVMLYVAVVYFDAAAGGLLSPEFEDAAWNLDKIWDALKHLAIPAVVLAWSATAFQIQTIRATMLDEVNKLSVTAARARGIPEFKLMMKYPARLALNPVASSVGFDVNRIFGELPIVALVLNLPELGELLLKSYIDQDMFVAGAILLILTTMIVLMNFISDILLAFLDPRIRLEGG